MCVVQKMYNRTVCDSTVDNFESVILSIPLYPIYTLAMSTRQAKKGQPQKAIIRADASRKVYCRRLHCLAEALYGKSRDMTPRTCKDHADVSYICVIKPQLDKLDLLYDLAVEMVFNSLDLNESYPDFLFAEI